MKHFAACFSAVILAMGFHSAAALAQSKEAFIPLLVIRTGPYAASGVPLANAFADYYTLINARDGGINGVKLVWEECDTQYDTKKGVECYERLKGKGAVLVYTQGTPFSTSCYRGPPRTRSHSSCLALA